MDNNDIMRRLRYVFNFNDKQIVEILKNVDYEITEEKISGILKKEEEGSFIKCSDDLLNYFLDGLILKNRGKNDDNKKEIVVEKMSNNLVLKKLKIALNLKSEEIQGILMSVGVDVSNSEISAVMRREGHRNYKECGDRYLRNFIKGLSEYVKN